MTNSDDIPRVTRIPGEYVGSPLKGWMPYDPTASKFKWWLKELMLGTVICFTLALETIGFAMSANIGASQGIHSAWILNVVCGIFGGRPALITGFSGASTACFRFFLGKPEDGKTVGEGIEYIYPTVILCGCFMFLFGLCRLAERTMNILSSSVMIGFCCGLAINICKSQFHFYEVCLATLQSLIFTTHARYTMPLFIFHFLRRRSVKSTLPLVRKFANMNLSVEKRLCGWLSLPSPS